MKACANIVVLISGGGSNLQSIINACEDQLIPARVSGVISNRPGAYGLERARRADIPSHTLDHKRFASREAFDNRLAAVIDEFDPDLIVLAGFMRILTDTFVENHLGKLINIHPSLLPKYPGLNTHQRAIDAGDSEHGASIHYVTPELDAGPVILQGKVPVQPEDTAQRLAERVLQVEHKIYPQAIKWIVEGRIALNRHLVTLDGEPLTENGYQIANYNNGELM